MSYDPDNIFAKILRGEIPCDRVYDDEHVLAFKDIDPKAPTHILVIPKGHYVSATDFSAQASAEEITAFFRAIHQIIKDHHLEPKGYRLVANTGNHGGQEVPHFHMHILAGEKIGPLRSTA